MMNATDALKERLKKQGPMRFDAFMAFALYDPEYGYYTSGQGIFGRQGDFVTAPELTPLFGQTIGHAILEVLPLCKPVIYEFGAGNGKLASDLLNTLGDTVEQYNIVDVSGGLKQVQSETIRASVPGHIADRVQWLEQLPEQLEGILIGNEVLDAMPVRVFEYHHDASLEWWISEEITLEKRPLQASDRGILETLHTQHGPWQDGHLVEWAEQAHGFVKTLTERLNGLALMIDYGDCAEKLLHPAKRQGTLRAHKNHVAHDGFLTDIGEQDLTAHVNFSQIYEAMHSEGGQLEGYCIQASFLLAHGILELAGQNPALTDPVAGAQTRKALNTLLSEAEMGENFKVFAWSRGVDLDATRLNTLFLMNDRSGEL